MSTEAFGPYQRVLRSLHRADLLSRRVADQQLGERIGIGRAMFLILDMLACPAADGISQQAIADQLGLTKAAVSRHIAAARDQGWLSAQPSPGSRRENSVTLTPSGRELVEQGRHLRAEAERQATEELGTQELQRTAHTLERLAGLLEQRLHTQLPLHH